jgi:hypothetical protein
MQRLHTLNKKHKQFETNKIQLLERLLDIRRETDLLVEIKDILDEIKIILSIIRTQKSILKEIAPTYGDSSHLADAQRILKTSIADFKQMSIQAEAVQSSVSSDGFNWRILR